ncbi:hypothetical protein [Streptomyces sp. NBC_00576]|uniref:hypothetical protein n=1 Tax=Streptomyces sp. NBC_00576 TaxID=2903665 RepID=UPI002E80A3F2|nr:hypothetical protein [Streptomyces sp. NBC_00576]WUB77691.1 hypothetical protein OG734_47840 [Streptomyces sp. NBC_00576]
MARRDLRAGAQATVTAQPPANGTGPQAPTGTVVATTDGTAPDKLRDQPFTLAHWGATLPEQDLTPEEASGPLSDEEQLQLAECHRAVDNSRAAQWLLGRALEIVRRRRLYRGDGSRTWPQYLAAEHDSMTEREARRLQDEWRLAKAVQDALGRPAPASHVRAMLDYADSTSDEQAARDYAMLRTAFEEAQVRLKADQITARVSKALEPAADEKDSYTRRQAVEVRWREIYAPQLSIPAPSKAPEAAQAARTAREVTDPLVDAVKAVERALERVDSALMDGSATDRRSTAEAEHLQKRLRKVGRILAKATVSADDVIDAEVVEDDEEARS